ncbi:uncharacterized protein BX664DRAFT_321278, partial [Halteromyces radiatus]|uniref:uncharacterized protein n=1 Tax=Halteromyces radiatus TaxID=101107 RepID=UPI00221F8A2A
MRSFFFSFLFFFFLFLKKEDIIRIYRSNSIHYFFLWLYSLHKPRFHKVSPIATHNIIYQDIFDQVYCCVLCM